MPHKSLASSPALKGGASARQNLVNKSKRGNWVTYPRPEIINAQQKLEALIEQSQRQAVFWKRRESQANQPRKKVLLVETDNSNTTISIRQVRGKKFSKCLA